MEKQINSLFSILLFLCLLGCKGNGYVKVSGEGDFPMEVTDDFKKARVYVQKGKPESYTRYAYWPKEPMVIQGVPCKDFTLNGNGKLITYTLSRDHELNGTVLPKGTSYQACDWGEEGKTDYLLTLPEITEIQGYQVLNKQAQGYHHVDLYKDGKLKLFVSAVDVEIDGIFCKGGKKKLPIFLDNSGNLIGCVLAKDITVGGKLHSVGSTYNVSMVKR